MRWGAHRGGGYVHAIGIPESEALCLQVSFRSSFLKTIMDGSVVSLGGRQLRKREVWKRSNDFDVVFALVRIILLVLWASKKGLGSLL